MSPVNSFEGAKRVIGAGADEIYFGVLIPGLEWFIINREGISCNLQSYDELKKVVDFAHNSGVQVALVMNMHFMSKSIEQIFKKHINQCLEIIGSDDAIIVGHLGIYNMIKKLIPDNPFYASTLLITTNTYSADFIQKIGFSRVILERQLTINEIKDIVKSTKLEIEVFIHGTGCSNLNGNCYLLHFPNPLLLSELKKIDGFNPPCRLNFKVNNLVDKKSLGNMQILDAYTYCSLCSLPQLIQSGVHALKIVGRCQNFEKQASVTKIYREFSELIAEGKIASYKEKLHKFRSSNKLFYYENGHGLIPLRMSPDLSRFAEICCSQNRCYFPHHYDNVNENNERR